MYTKERSGFGTFSLTPPFWVILMLVLSVCSWASGVSASSLYTYVNDDGAVVLTDDLKSVPERYRSRVKVAEFNDEPRTDAGAAVAAILAESTTGGSTRSFIDRLPDFTISGLSTYQSYVLAGGFLGAVLAFAAMTLTRSPALSFAMKWVLMFMVVGVIYALYFSELKTYGELGSDGTAASSDQPTSVVDRVKGKTKAVEDMQQRRFDRIDSLTQP